MLVDTFFISMDAQADGLNGVFDSILMFSLGLRFVSRALATVLSLVVTLWICSTHFLKSENQPAILVIDYFKQSGMMFLLGMKKVNSLPLLGLEYHRPYRESFVC